MREAADPRRRDAWLDIDLAAIRHNIAAIRPLAGGAAIVPVVKADAYGHGREAVVDAISDDVGSFCVATLDEALAVRGQVPNRVLLLYPVPAAAVAEAAAARIELTIMSPVDLEVLRRVAPERDVPLAVHLCVETGLGRGGLIPEGLLAAARIVSADARLVLAGVWSHLSSPEDADASRRQSSRFEAAVAELGRHGIPVPPRHLAASGGLFGGTAAAYEAVRLGLAVYGVLDEQLPLAGPAARRVADALRPAMSLRARAVATSDIPIGGGVGYGSRWRAERPSRVAILPVGYADGYLRGAQPGAHALLRGRRLPLVGVISMDALAVDVTDVPDLSGHDEFVLLGQQGAEAITAGELARARNTIAWEVLSSMAARLARVYHR